jgi:hypothetical protein
METEKQIVVSYKNRVAFLKKRFKKRFCQKEFPRIVKYNKKPANKTVD